MSLACSACAKVDEAARIAARKAVQSRRIINYPNLNRFLVFLLAHRP
jgi:hypothetical protein